MGDTGPFQEFTVRIVALFTIAFAWSSLFVGTERVSALNPFEGGYRARPAEDNLLPEELRFFCKVDLPHLSTTLPGLREFQSALQAHMADQTLLTRLKNMMACLSRANREGLRPEDYHLAAIEALLTEVQQEIKERGKLNPEKQRKLQNLFSSAFATYGSHLLNGRVDPQGIYPDWIIEDRKTAVIERLGTKDLDVNQLEKTLERLRPKNPGYMKLKQALEEYHKIAGQGGWPVLEQGPTVRKGDQGKQVADLRARLIASGDMVAPEEPSYDLFDEDLDTSVRRFQERHGLKVDGIVGRDTVAVLNVSVKRRIRQIEVNLERWRWLPRDLGERYIMVNTAGYALDAVERSGKAMNMRVIAGKNSRPTPFISSKMTYLVLSPYWHVPHTIAKKDILPKVQEDIGYLERKNIRVFRNWENDAPEMNAQNIDWSQVTKKSFSFKLRQEPGPENALGSIKFMFHNKSSVYLHDTNAPGLFERTTRNLSSGCIRIEKPVELATFLFQDDPEWTRERILKVAENSKNRTLWLPESIQTYIMYWTAWVDEDGSVHFREDVYERDKVLELALSNSAPHSVANSAVIRNDGA